MTEDLLDKYLNDNCTADELQAIIRWMDSEALQKKEVKKAFTQWEKYQPGERFLEEERSLALLYKIHHEINIQQQKNKPETTIHRIGTILAKVAAVLFLPVAGILFFWLMEKQHTINSFTDATVDSLEIIAPVGSQTLVQLSDGSEVFLNYGSRLKYPKYFTGPEREVVLTGEGYFNVNTNPEKPFVVKTGNLRVKALGTAFNVMAYPRDTNIETTLVEGKLEITRQRSNGSVHSVGILTPGQHLVYNLQTNNFICTEGEIDEYISWKDGKLIFRNESIVNIANRLGRWYNVEFEIKDAEARDFTYTATFVDETVYQILDLMAIATPIKYKIVPRLKLQDGSFSKQKIIIERK
ncbi:MAG: DUF4974 domain-containing protein [Prolixibacteraceae bacterium]|nr:DUF4974 domain-containing protein [Prolixibacteraceae bacterium]